MAVVIVLLNSHSILINGCVVRYRCDGVKETSDWELVYEVRQNCKSALDVLSLNPADFIC